MDVKLSSGDGRQTFRRRVPQSWVCVLLSALCGAPAPAADLTLSAAVRRFLERNPEASAERETLEVARRNLRQAGRLPNPTLHFSQEGFSPERSEAGFFRDQEFILWASQPLELGGKRGRRRNLAELEVALAQARFDDFVRRKTLSIAGLWIEAFYAQERFTLLDQLTKDFRQLLMVHRQRLEEGEVSRVAQLQLEAEELTFVTATAAAERRRHTLWNQLAALIGWEDPETPQLTLPPLGPADTTPHRLQEQAVNQRPDLEASRLRERIAEAEWRLARAQAVPDLNLGGGYKRDFGVNSFYLGFQIELPVFDRKAGAIGGKRAEWRRQSQLAAWEEIRVRSQVGRALETYANLLRTLERFGADYPEKLAEIVAVTRLSYQEGEAGIHELLAVLRSRRDAALGRLDLLSETHAAYHRLLAATGGSVPTVRRP